MALQKITAADPIEMTGFVVTDLDTAERADGVVRCAKKILIDGARTMARSRSYAWALLGERRSGASAGINALGEHRGPGIAAFVDAVADAVRAGTLSLDAAKGLGEADLAPLAEVDHRDPLLRAQVDLGRVDHVLLGTGVAAAAESMLGGLDGRTVAIEGAGDAGPAVASVLAAHGVRVVAVSTASGTLRLPDGLDPDGIEAWTEHAESFPTEHGSEEPAGAVLGVEADVLVCGSKLGLIDHEAAASLGAGLVLPIGPAPVTAKGLAVAGRHEVVVLADFLTTAGPLLAFDPVEGRDADAVVELTRTRVGELAAEAAQHPDGPYLGACSMAERFLSTWLDELPFGRPLA